MRVYHNKKEVMKLKAKAKAKGFNRIFLAVNRTIPECRLFKGNIIEADEYDKKTQTYIVNTGYGNIMLWKSMVNEI